MPKVGYFLVYPNMRQKATVALAKNPTGILAKWRGQNWNKILFSGGDLLYNVP
jgi:hypothetical protein